MNTLFMILAILALIGSVLITLIVLLQNSKGGGLASNFTAGNQTFGVRQTTDILEKITWGLAIFILVVSIVASFTYDKGGLADQADSQPNGKIENTDQTDQNQSDDNASADDSAVNQSVGDPTSGTEVTEAAAEVAGAAVAVEVADTLIQ